jgi:hypothetical protein
MAAAVLSIPQVIAQQVAIESTKVFAEEAFKETAKVVALGAKFQRK